MVVTPARLPPPVGPGDRVGVAALSGPVERRPLELGLGRLRELGFDPVVAANLAARDGMFAGSDAERLAAFHRMAGDPEIKAIFFARGGHGVLRLLPDVDWALLERHPRAYVGYSDVTLFLNQLVARLGLASFHGPMAAVDLAREMTTAERRSLLDALAGELPLTVGVEPLGKRAFDVRGPLVGGCLSLLTAGLGTDYRVATDGAILFWEDVNEPLYRIDRMLTQLRLSGSLAGIRGMVVGSVQPAAVPSADGTPPARHPPDSPAAERNPANANLDQLLKELTRLSDWPIAVGCASGHCAPNLTLALGLEARLSSGARSLAMGIA